MASKADLLKECKRLRTKLEGQHTAIRITADGQVEQLSPDETAHLVTKSGDQRVTRRVVTILVIRKH